VSDAAFQGKRITARRKAEDLERLGENSGIITVVQQQKL
jgi:hypothetical protein